jgi:hypothetical protein
MTLFNKGDYVQAVKGGSFHTFRGSSYGGLRYVTIEQGDELLVTSMRGTYLNVRKAKGGPVFRLDYTQVRAIPRNIGQVPPDGLDVDDPRIQWIWDDAIRLADRLGLCRDFDKIADELGIPGREREFTLKYDVTPGVNLTAKVKARSKKLAEEKLRSSMAVDAPRLKSIAAQ